MFDHIDKVIITELQKNGREPLSHIAEKTGISHVAVKKRLVRLIKRDLIKVSANITLDPLKAKMATLIVEVENYPRLKELIDIFKECPRIIFLASLSASQLISIIIGEDLRTLENVIGVCSIRTQKGVRRSEVHIGDLPEYPKYLPIRISSSRDNEYSPCNIRCDVCGSFRRGECFGCPATPFYEGPL